MGKRDHAVEISKARDVLGQDDDMVVLLPVRIGIGKDIFNHVPFHAVDDLLLVLVRQILDLWESLYDAVVCNCNGRMMPLGSRLDDFLIINQSVQAHLRMEMELDAGRRIIVFMIDLDDFSFFHLLQFKDKAAGILVKAYVAAHLDCHPCLQFFQSACFFRAVEEFLAGNAVRFIGKAHQKELLLAPKFPHFTINDSAHKNDPVCLISDCADFNRISGNMLLAKVHAIDGP